jgi:hypothetical protein
VGTVATGFLGMNLFSHSDLGGAERLAIFFIVFIPTIVLTMYTLSISRRLATFMEALASERLTWGEKQDAFRQIWFSAKKAKIARIESGEVARRRAPLPTETTEAAHSAD